MPPWTDLCPQPISTPEEFLAFLDAVGVCTWTPMPSLDFPNLQEAMAIDDVYGPTWFWKDDLHIAHQLFYGKLLAGRPTFVSMGLLPAVVAARGDVDPHTFHEQGRLTEAAVRVYDTLLAHRRLTTGELRNMAGLSGSGGRQQFEKATVTLNALFQICKVEITGRHLSTYSYVWGLMEDWGPEVLRAAARLRPAEAAGEVAGRLASVGVAMSPREWKRLFGWDDEVLPQ